MRRRRLAAAVLAAGALTVAGSVAVGLHRSSPGGGSAPAQRCHSVNGLPDRKCTPGAINPAVTQANIGSTICVSGWTSTVRPPASYTNALKLRQIAEYGFADRNPAHYEEDHLVALEVGGAPRDPRNLWPEPRSGAHAAGAKDVVENRLHALVCSGQRHLAAAQISIAMNWETAG